jgi:hypothetical protein
LGKDIAIEKTDWLTLVTVSLFVRIKAEETPFPHGLMLAHLGNLAASLPISQKAK